MIAIVAISLRLGHRCYDMRPGKPVPQPVLDHWKKTGLVDQMVKSKLIGEPEAAGVKEQGTGAAPKTSQTTVQKDGQSVRTGKS